MSVGADPLHVLLSFALAHGNVNTILDTLQILIGGCGLVTLAGQVSNSSSLVGPFVESCLTVLELNNCIAEIFVRCTFLCFSRAE